MTVHYDHRGLRRVPGSEAKMTGVINTELSSIGQIAMPVRDLARGVGFYRGRLVLRFLFQVPPGLAFFQCGSIRLMVEVPPDKEFQRPGSGLYTNVGGIGE